MSEGKDREQILFCDFDGTISLDDVNELLFEVFGDSRTRRLEEKFRAGELDDRRVLVEKFSHLDLTEKELKEFVREEVRLDPSFKQFLQLAEGLFREIVIVSGGFREYIEALFDREEIDFKGSIYANRLDFGGEGPSPRFLHQVDPNDCHQPFGVCGCCKWLIFQRRRTEGTRTVYIGDGLTDRCLAEEVDLLFAKEGELLAKYCDERGIPYRPFSDFRELVEFFSRHDLDSDLPDSIPTA